jgi:hypothetical protein
MKAIRLFALLALSGLLAACSHDTKRENPLDPKLTSGVELVASLDRTTQTASLAWTRYNGRAPFGQYLVVRQISDRVSVDTLARLTDSADTTYVDTPLDPATDYLYRVSVVNTAGLEVSSELRRIAAFDLPAVRITELALDAPSATAAITWSRYEGPDFEQYRLLRGAGSDSRQVATLTNIDSTHWLDSELRGDTEYTYTVTVATQRGHSTVSEPAAGRIHGLVTSWSLGEEDAIWEQDIRLQWRDGALEVLLFGSTVTLYRHQSDGVLLDREELLAVPMWDLQSGIAAAAAPVIADGTRLLAWAGLDYRGLLLHRQGDLVEAEKLLAFDPDPGTETSGRVRLRAVIRAAHFRSVITVDSAGLESVADFSSMPEYVTRADVRRDAEIVNGWAFKHAGGSHTRQGDWMSMTPSGEGVGDFAQQIDATGPSIGVSAQVIARPVAEVLLGVDAPAQLTFRLSGPSPGLVEIGEVSIVWTRPGRSDTVRAPFPVFDLPIQVSMQTVDDAPQASITYPVLWAQELSENRLTRMSLAGVDQHSAWTVGNQALAVDGEGTVALLAELSSGPTDIRTWQLEGESRPRLAVCLPDENQVRFGSVFRGSRWTDALRGGSVGLRIGAGGTLFYPLSVAAGPDGRMYVLDAGHGRVVVFDRDGGYITEFGASGSGDGEFDFGPGTVIANGLDLKGSIAVDDDGFIYVADMGNRRIQKFAP